MNKIFTILALSSTITFCSCEDDDCPGDPLDCKRCEVAQNVTSGIVACYEFNGNPNDLSGNNQHGSTFGNPIYTTVGEIDFGTPQSINKIDLPPSILSGLADFSILTRFKLNSYTQDVAVLLSGFETGDEFELAFTSNFVRLIIKDDIHHYFNHNFALNTFYDLALVRSLGTANIIVNSSPIGLNQVSSPNETISCQSLILGQEQDALGGGHSTSDCFPGVVDYLIFFDHALSLNDIQLIAAECE